MFALSVLAKLCAPSGTVLRNVYIMQSDVPAQVIKLKATLDKAGNIKKKKPRDIRANMMAVQHGSPKIVAAFPSRYCQFSRVVFS